MRQRYLLLALLANLIFVIGLVIAIFVSGVTCAHATDTSERSTRTVYITETEMTMLSQSMGVLHPGYGFVDYDFFETPTGIKLKQTVYIRGDLTTACFEAVQILQNKHVHINNNLLEQASLSDDPAGYVVDHFTETAVKHNDLNRPEQYRDIHEACDITKYYRTISVR